MQSPMFTLCCATRRSGKSHGCVEDLQNFSRRTLVHSAFDLAHRRDGNGLQGATPRHILQMVRPYTALVARRCRGLGGHLRAINRLCLLSCEPCGAHHLQSDAQQPISISSTPSAHTRCCFRHAEADATCEAGVPSDFCLAIQSWRSRFLLLSFHLRTSISPQGMVLRTTGCCGVSLLRIATIGASSTRRFTTGNLRSDNASTSNPHGCNMLGSS